MITIPGGKRVMNHFRKISHQSLAGFLMIWMSGFIFLFCCEMAAAGTLEGEFCPLSKAQSHCDKSVSDNDAQVISNQSDGLSPDCCAFLPVFFDKTRKIEKAQQAAPVSSKLIVDRPHFTIVSDNRAISANYRAATLPQNNLHIRNCILRI